MSRRLQIICAFVASLVLIAPPAPAQSVFAGFTGQLIVASPRMADPRFANSVVYIFLHSEGGARGLIVNQRVGEVPLAEIYQLADLETTGTDDLVGLFIGGPVTPRVGTVLHEAATGTDDSILVESRYAVTGWRSFLGRVTVEGLPDRAIFALGFASWGPGQLEREVIAGAWTSHMADLDLVFGADPDTMWERIADNPESTL